MAWVDIPDTALDADSPLTVSLMTALRDNVAALAEQSSGAPIMLGTLRAFTMITVSTTHVCTDETRHTIACLWSGGGGGDGVSAASSAQAAGGLAGTMKWSYAARSGGDSLTATVGAGGAGGSIYGGAGGVGGTTSLTGHASAYGGGSNESYNRGETGYGLGAAAKSTPGAGNAAAANTAAGGGGANGDGLYGYVGGAGGSGRILILEF